MQPLTFIRAYRYEIIAASVGAIVMMVELVGARLIAPYLGTSIFVWTAVIGVILGALSFGYWYGGRLADRSASDRVLAKLILLATFLLLAGFLAAEAVLQTLAASGMDTRISALLASLLLFAPATALLGMESPYVVKLRLKSLATAGSAVGRLYAAGTIGSIIGTFASGYFLIGLFGSALLSLLLVLALIGVSVIADRRSQWRLRLGLVGATLVVMALGFTSNGFRVLYDTDSSYSRYQVIEQPEAGRQLRILKMGDAGAQSGVFPDDPSEIVFDYTRRFMEAAEAVRPECVLMIGGGAFTVPRALVERYPDVRVDVVEIDPKLTELSERFFFYEPDERIRIINQDGRVFLNGNTATYDLIFIDAFSSLTPPFQLTTKEAVERMAAAAGEDGVVVVNLIGSVVGDDSRFTKSETRTFESVFGDYRLLQARGGVPAGVRQNLILIAARDASKAESLALELDGVRVNLAIDSSVRPLTDDFAPVEQLSQ